MTISIIGAGLSGLLAASQFPEAQIYEKQSREIIKSHRALLRFRSDKIGRALGIPFKEVTVHKAIWSEGNFIKPNPKVCNQYSLKVAGTIEDRSIWNIDTCKRWIAPENLHELLLERFNDRIEWNSNMVWFEKQSASDNVISTVPMYNTLNFCDTIKYDKEKYVFNKQKITVRRYRVPESNVYQTIYFPDPSFGVYRASLNGNRLIVESIDNDSFNYFGISMTELIDCFGISMTELIDCITQTLGKITYFNDIERKHLIYEMSRDYGIYSLGRFAIWKNILLDDVWNDIEVIKQLINKNEYELLKNNLL